MCSALLRGEPELSIRYTSSLLGYSSRFTSTLMSHIEEFASDLKHCSLGDALEMSFRIIPDQVQLQPVVFLITFFNVPRTNLIRHFVPLFFLIF